MDFSKHFAEAYAMDYTMDFSSMDFSALTTQQDDYLIDDYVPPAYTPVGTVRAAHGIPHFDQGFNSVSNKFDVLDDSGAINTTYLLSCMSMPICIIVIGVLSLIIYQLVLCFRCCCQHCCKHCVSKDHMVIPDGDKSSFCWRMSRHRPVLMTLYWLSLIGALIANYCMYIGRVYVDRAYSSGYDSLTALAAVFNNALTATEGLFHSAGNMVNLLNSQQCSAVFSGSDDTASGQVNSFNSSADSIGGFIGSLPEKIEDARDQFASYQGTTDEVLYIYFAFIVFLILLNVLLTLCRSKAYLNFLIAFTELIVLTLTIIAGVEMIVVVS
jgi:hypothetical protein